MTKYVKQCVKKKTASNNVYQDMILRLGTLTSLVEPEEPTNFIYLGETQIIFNYRYNSVFMFIKRNCQSKVVTLKI